MRNNKTTTLAQLAAPRATSCFLFFLATESCSNESKNNNYFSLLGATSGAAASTRCIEITGTQPVVFRLPGDTCCAAESVRELDTRKVIFSPLLSLSKGTTGLRVSFDVRVTPSVPLTQLENLKKTGPSSTYMIVSKKKARKHNRLNK